MKYLAILLGKLALFLTRVSQTGSGTTFPGLLAEKIDRNIIRKLSKRLDEGVIIVTGTNGKTTTAKMLSEILYEEGYSVLNNPSGSNLSRGIASALIRSTNFLGTHLSADIAVFEVDEATMPEVVSRLRPRIVVVTNLFRDQLDRYGELDKTADLIGRSLRGFTDLTAILNADDPLVSSLSRYSEGQVKYFGIESPEITTNSKAAMDSKDCLACGHELVYSSRYFGHLGIWSCPNCKNVRPKPEFTAEKIQLFPQKSIFELSVTETLKIEMTVPGLYNIYNALAAAATAEVVGSKGPAVSHALTNFAAAFGRMETIGINGRETMILLVKNPTGANQSLAAIFSDSKSKNICLVLNDNFADGTDVSWIWDVDFEAFDLSSHNFVVSGIRAEDMALRLKYANVSPEKIILIKEPVKAVEKLVELTPQGEYCYVLPTYTSMIEIRNAFAPKEDNLAQLGKVTKHGV